MTEHAPPTILVLGGTGKTGRRIAQRLRERGHPVRIGSRSARPAFDWQDQDTWPAALRGVGAVYIAYSPDAGLPGAAETIGAFARAAAAAQVQRLVLLTARGEDGARASERAVQLAGPDWTIVRSSFFAQDFSEDEVFVAGVRDGVVVFPAGDVAEPFVDAEDVADVATTALTEHGHAGAVYELTGPRLLTFADASAEVAAAAGREIAYLPVTEGQFVAGLIAQGVPAEFAAGLTAVFTEVLDGRNAHITDGVRRALGREPRDFADYAHAAAANGAWAGAPLVH